MYPAGETGISVRRITVSGLTLRVITSGADAGMAVVLVHGWGASVYSFAETIPALAMAGYRVVAIDLPGYGLSDKPTDEGRWATRALSDVVLGATKALGIERFTVVGHSMGGAIALDIACRGVPGLSGLVLVNAVGLGLVPAIPLLKLLSPKFVDRFTPVLLTRGLVRVILALAFGTRGRPNERDVDEYWAPSRFREYAWACRACVHRGTWRRTPENELRSLRVPALVIAGGRDPMVFGCATRARLLPESRVVVVGDGGHLVLQECAARVNAEIVRFLGQLRSL